MLSDGMIIREGGEIVNLTVATGTAFPLSPNTGEMFFRTDAPNQGLYVYDGTQWFRKANEVEVADLNHNHDSIYVPLIGNSSIDGTLTITTGHDIVLPDLPTNPQHAANKAYVDSVAAGLSWSNPLADPDLVRDDLTAPPGAVINYHESYLIGGTPTGAWAAFSAGDIVYYNGSSWQLVKALEVGDRFGILIEPSSFPPPNPPAGSFAGHQGKIVECTNNIPGSFAWDIITPAEGDALFVSYADSYHFAHSYTFYGVYGTGTFGTHYGWTEFGGPASIQAGTNLSYTGNTLNVVQGPGSNLHADLWDGANKHVSTSGPTGGSNGDLWFKYIP